MKGVVLDFNNKENIGLILGEDGNRYSFDYEKDWIDKNKLPKVDLDIQFEKKEEKAINIILDEQAHTTPHNNEKSSNPIIDNNVKVKKRNISKLIIFPFAIILSFFIAFGIGKLFKDETINSKFQSIWMYPEDLKIFMKVKMEKERNDCNVTFRIKDTNSKHQKEIIDFTKIKTYNEGSKGKVYISTIGNKYYKIETSDYGVKAVVLFATMSNCIDKFGKEVLNEQ